MPSGYGLSTDEAGQLDWSWAAQRLVASRNYWVCTSSRDGQPHVAPVWGLWIDDAFFFSSDPTSRKGRNIAAGSPVVAHLESGDDVVVIEGHAEPPPDRDWLERAAAAYKEKYDTPIDPDNPGHGMYVVRPTKALAWREQDFPTSATRYSFSSGA
jgi:pyridoxine/pyridoxamine 5'-phosphate oxidase